jgi:H+/gluconate symporter-like permease
VTRILALVAAMLCAAATCTPLPTPVPPAAAGGAGAGGSSSVGGATPATPSCETACAAMGRLGCPEGADQAKCLVYCRRCQTTPGSEMDQEALSCLTNATSIPGVRACGVAPCQ